MKFLPLFFSGIAAVSAVPWGPGHHGGPHGPHPDQDAVFKLCLQADDARIDGKCLNKVDDSELVGIFPGEGPEYTFKLAPASQGKWELVSTGDDGQRLGVRGYQPGDILTLYDLADLDPPPDPTRTYKKWDLWTVTPTDHGRWGHGRDFALDWDDGTERLKLSVTNFEGTDRYNIYWWNEDGDAEFNDRLEKMFIDKIELVRYLRSAGRKCSTLRKNLDSALETACLGPASEGFHMTEFASHGCARARARSRRPLAGRWDQVSTLAHACKRFVSLSLSPPLVVPPARIPPALLGADARPGCVKAIADARRGGYDGFGAVVISYKEAERAARIAQQSTELRKLRTVVITEANQSPQRGKELLAQTKQEFHDALREHLAGERIDEEYGFRIKLE
ncbi:hypothetical protein BDY21DRAFT_362748 [Lineolata rhizophorae]|uniref:Uncharacterized protein n=1 Tax=Lineolata rhizophorae TaxID=578093 RepID=A0A6A6P3P1_9PEZI|nr:hypothetical protein BDY21DRAFT_362748 [Lineolata rhizophorae]